MHIVHPEDGRLIPFDTYNLFYRDNLERDILGPLRGDPPPAATLPIHRPSDPELELRSSKLPSSLRGGYLS